MARAGIFGNPVANVGFGQATGVGRGGHSVHLGGVYKIDASGQRAAEDGVGALFAHLLTKGHGAQTNGRDVQVGLTKLYFFHGLVFGCVLKS